jgi:hypothetical protein
MRDGVAFAGLLPGLLLASVIGCEGDRQEVSSEHPVAIREGTYRVAFGQGYSPADEARLLALTARVDRIGGQVMFTMADGSQQVLTFSPRPRSERQPACFTMSSHSLNEVADLSPAPLRLESLTFLTPVAFAYCAPTRMIVADDEGNPSVFLAFDLR